MTGLQLAILCGGLVGLGLTFVVSRLLPAHPHLQSAFDRLDPSPTASAVDTVTIEEFRDRVGVWVQRRGPSTLWTRIPEQELTLLRRPMYRHLGEKALFALVGLLFPAAFTMLTAVLGVSIGFVMPVFAALLLAGLFWFIPDITVKREAKKARADFVRALASYIDLVALERASGTGSTQSLEAAASVGSSWTFTRISEELARSRWSGHPPWDGLKDLADQLAVSELADLAEIMRLSGEESASVAGQLRARATSMRGALLNEDLARANAAGEQMSAPVSMLALVFLAMLAVPAVLRIATSG